MEACRKDFRNFKKGNGNEVIDFMNERIEQFVYVSRDLKEISDQKDNIESIRKLIEEGKEDIAFSMFFRTFPTCLPYRSIR